jgi:hypothetical protein
MEGNNRESQAFRTMKLVAPEEEEEEEETN